jgi:hypothetical protein
VTFNWYQSLVSLLRIAAWRENDVASLHHHVFGGGTCFDGTNFVSWKTQLSSYLCEINPQAWYMIDVGFSHTLEDCPQTRAQEKYLYLDAHASKVLSSALSVEVGGMIEIEYDLFGANILWKALEQIYGSNNDKKSSSTNIPKNISSSSMHIDQDQVVQSSIQHEKVKSANLGKPDVPVLIEQKQSYWKKIIALYQAPMMMIVLLLLLFLLLLMMQIKCS